MNQVFLLPASRPFIVEAASKGNIPLKGRVGPSACTQDHSGCGAKRKAAEAASPIGKIFSSATIRATSSYRSPLQRKGLKGWVGNGLSG